ncbi:hypothetical protein [Clostridium tagluense]|uniref:hypothetical protein n=1 Tax=Clostridium tagluense TaxID=360422 RepID=UPI001C0D611B|nr:hypothetical protein [Clostridium tagluense]MBU3130132.1 hypothetical protein [Clostridium tagluense]
MKILVMGGTEFVSSALTKYLISKGYIVDIFTRGIKPSSLYYNLLSISPSFLEFHHFKKKPSWYILNYCIYMGIDR